MDKTQSISDRIIAEADSGLRTDIENMVRPFHNTLTNGLHGDVVITVRTCDDPQQAVRVLWHQALIALKEAAFQIRAPRCREEAISNFMQKVKNL